MLSSDARTASSVSHAPICGARAAVAHAVSAIVVTKAKRSTGIHLAFMTRPRSCGGGFISTSRAYLTRLLARSGCQRDTRARHRYVLQAIDDVFIRQTGERVEPQRTQRTQR